MATPRTPREQAEKPRSRAFQIRDSGETTPRRICLGADPRVSIGAGETFATTDPRLADRLAADPLLEEVTR